jgi:hypothetical protein
MFTWKRGWMPSVALDAELARYYATLLITASIRDDVRITIATRLRQLIEDRAAARHHPQIESLQTSSPCAAHARHELHCKSHINAQKLLRRSPSLMAGYSRESIIGRIHFDLVLQSAIPLAKAIARVEIGERLDVSAIEP